MKHSTEIRLRAAEIEEKLWAIRDRIPAPTFDIIWADLNAIDNLAKYLEGLGG